MRIKKEDIIIMNFIQGFYIFMTMVECLLWSRYYGAMKIVMKVMIHITKIIELLIEQ